MCRRIARDPDVVQIFEFNSGRFETITNRVRWKTRGVLKTIEALFFSRGDQPSILDNGRRRVSVIRVDPQDVHLSRIL